MNEKPTLVYLKEGISAHSIICILQRYCNERNTWPDLVKVRFETGSDSKSSSVKSTAMIIERG